VDEGEGVGTPRDCPVEAFPAEEARKQKGGFKHPQRTSETLGLTLATTEFLFPFSGRKGDPRAFQVRRHKFSYFLTYWSKFPRAVPKKGQKGVEGSGQSTRERQQKAESMVQQTV
jgi:hypothetical protein